MRVVFVDNWLKANQAVTYRVWGRSRNIFSHWEKGEILVILVARTGAVLGSVAGPGTRSELMIWDNDLFEWRIPLANMVSYSGETGVALNTKIRDVLRKDYQNNYGYVLRNQQRVGADSQKAISQLVEQANHDRWKLA